MPDLARVVAVAAIVATVTAGCGSATAGGPWPSPSGDLLTSLNLRVAGLMERDFRAEVTGRPKPIVCAARAFGVNPAAASSLSTVETVYAWVFCEETTQQPLGDRVSIPVAIRLTGSPRIEVPSSGESYPDDVARIFPESLRDTAIKPPDYVADLRAEVERRLGQSGTPTPQASAS